MTLQYQKITIYTSEDVHWRGRPLSDAVLEYIRNLKLAARCTVNRGIAGCYENGTIATTNILDLSYNLPVTIDILIPVADTETVLPQLEEMVVDGVVVITDLTVNAYHSTKRLIPQQLKVKEIMTPSPQTATPTTPIKEVIELMLDGILKGIPVVDPTHHPIGIITANDLTAKAGLPLRPGLLRQLDQAKVAAFIQSVDGKKTGDVMNAPLITIKEDQFVTDAVRTLIRHHLKRLPVVNNHGVLVGMIARIDIFRAITSQAPQWRASREPTIAVQIDQPVKAIVERDLETVYPDTPISEVLAKIAHAEIQRVAVTDRNGKLIGLICDSDLMPLVAGHPGFWDYLASKLALSDKRRFAEFAQHARARTAAEVMIGNPVAVSEDATIEEAIRRMTEQGFKRLPVVDSQGIFQGMISRDAVLQTVSK